MHYHHSTATVDGGPSDRLLRAARCFELAGHTHHAASCLKRAGEFACCSSMRKLRQPILEAKVLSSAAEKAPKSARQSTLMQRVQQPGRKV